VVTVATLCCIQANKKIARLEEELRRVTQQYAALKEWAEQSEAVRPQ
jgi:hypothetical protein